MAKKPIKMKGKKTMAKAAVPSGAVPMQPYKMEIINSVRQLITAMGGPTAAEKAMEGRVARNAISMWSTEGRVPERHHYRVDRWARRNGYLINPKLLGEKQLFPEEQKLLKAA